MFFVGFPNYGTKISLIYDTSNRNLSFLINLSHEKESILVIKKNSSSFYPNFLDLFFNFSICTTNFT